MTPDSLARPPCPRAGTMPALQHVTDPIVGSILYASGTTPDTFKRVTT
jgi:hypothetical protein